MSSPVTVTELAATKIAEYANGDDVMLRVGVKGGGCSGFQYQLAFDLQRDDDQLYESRGVSLLIDDASLPYVQGSTLDFEDGLMGAGFRVDNPNAVGACGCGSSFRMSDDAPSCGSAL